MLFKEIRKYTEKGRLAGPSRVFVSSKKIGNNQKLIKSKPTPHPQNRKGKKPIHRLINFHENRTDSSPLTHGNSATIIENSSKIYFYLFLFKIINKQKQQQEQKKKKKKKRKKKHGNMIRIETIVVVVVVLCLTAL